MKKIIIPAFALFAILLGIVVFAVVMSFNNTQYVKDALAHVMAVNDGGELTAEYQGRTTRVLGSNMTRIQKIVTVTERRPLLIKPKYDPQGAIKLHFSDGAEYIIAEDPSVSDGAFVLYSYKGRNLYFSIKGYKTIDWTIRAVSPEGIYEPNEQVSGL